MIITPVDSGATLIRRLLIGLFCSALVGCLTTTNTPSAVAASPRVVVLHNAVTERCVDVPAYGPGRVGGPVNQFYCDSSSADNQQWFLVPHGLHSTKKYPVYLIKNVKDGLCLDLPLFEKVRAGTPVSEYHCRVRDNQLFYVAPSPVGGTNYLVNVKSGLCLDVAGVRTGGNDARLTLAKCNRSDDHHWSLRPAKSSILSTAARIQDDGWRQSNNVAYRFIQQRDGNLVLYRNRYPIWASGVSGRDLYTEMQFDGNLVTYSPPRLARWASNTDGNGRSNPKLVVQNDGNAVIYDGGRAIWSTGTSINPNYKQIGGQKAVCAKYAKYVCARAKAQKVDDWAFEESGQYFRERQDARDPLGHRNAYRHCLITQALRDIRTSNSVKAFQITMGHESGDNKANHDHVVDVWNNHVAAYLMPRGHGREQVISNCKAAVNLGLLDLTGGAKREVHDAL